MSVDIWFFDFETFYTQEYSLRKMTPVEYILDSRFEAIGCAVQKGVDGPTDWVDGPDLPAFFSSLPRNIVGVSHNWLFDGCVLAWRYDFIPQLMVCTMSVARAVLSHILRSVSLDSVAKYLDLPSKGSTVHKVVGLNAAAIKLAGFYEEYVEYSKRDCLTCSGIFDRLVVSGVFPPSELFVMDTVMRCAVQPRFVLDSLLLNKHLEKLQRDKEVLLAKAMLAGASNKTDLMSNDRFADLLRNLGVEPPTKISLRTNKPTYAFAKTDQGMIDLEEHDDPAVQALAAARLGHKSTIEESRTERLISISELKWPDLVTHSSNEPYMPVPLRFSGAQQTHRLSGDWKLNMQNMPRGSALRRALMARPGEKVIAGDASQIEARTNAWFCGQDDLVTQFERGEDVYCNFASNVFGRPITKAENKSERFVGKTCVLGLGYQVGAPKLQDQIKTKSRAELGQEMLIPIEESIHIVHTYRTINHRITAMWALLQNTAIPVLAGNGTEIQLGPVIIRKGEIELPNKLKLYYPDVKYINGKWRAFHAQKPKDIYGGALLENIIQALARICTMDAAIRIRKRVQKANIWLNLQSHDELVYLVPSEFVEPVMGIIEEEMVRRPWWAPGLPLAAEVAAGSTYGNAK